MSSNTHPQPTPKYLLTTLLTTIEQSIIPLTHTGVAAGSKLFGAAIFSPTLTPLSIATNNERLSPLFHGEIYCLHRFFTVAFPDVTARPDPTDCYFLATHEPCSLCLSGITWSGFRRIFFLFTYEDSRDLFGIPYDIEILREVFRVKAEGEGDEALERRPLYNKENKFFKAEALSDLVEKLASEQDKAFFRSEIERVKGIYNRLSGTYQQGKAKGVITSSHFK